MTYQFLVNGTEYIVNTDPDESLLWVLRDKLKLTGTKYGCGEGACGSCTVLINGIAEKSCSINVEDIKDGSEIITIEGVGSKEQLSRVQQAFLDHHAFACGFCTSGMIMAATDLLNTNPTPSRKEIVDGMNDNLCRCATYPNILAAIEAVAEENSNG
jgi:aerobic-type carbon monoxide dehydrogenase small subunit (CoxS/CutS family)